MVLKCIMIEISLLSHLFRYRKTFCYIIDTGWKSIEDNTLNPYINISSFEST